MKSLLLALSLGGLTLAACTPTDQSTVGGSLAGAAIGAAVAGDGDRAEGALAGAAVGAIAGNLIGRSNRPGECVYQDRYGRRYTASCR